jgi:hypothetical protein
MDSGSLMVAGMVMRVRSRPIMFFRMDQMLWGTRASQDPEVEARNEQAHHGGKRVHRKCWSGWVRCCCGGEGEVKQDA